LAVTVPHIIQFTSNTEHNILVMGADMLATFHTADFLISFDSVPACDKQTDRWTDAQTK